MSLKLLPHWSQKLCLGIQERRRVKGGYFNLLKISLDSGDFSPVPHRDLLSGVQRLL